MFFFSGLAFASYAFPFLVCAPLRTILVCSPTYLLTIHDAFSGLARFRYSRHCSFAAMAAVAHSSSGPVPFEISVGDDVLEDLRRRLRSVRLPDQDVPNEDWAYGSELGYVRELVSHWIDKYDWRETERYLNGGMGCGAAHWTLQLPVEDGNPGSNLRVHFVSAGDKTGVPLLLLHGWPGSFFEFHRILPLLVDMGFHVVAPSLPGYGFSERPHTRHFDTAAMARTLDLLMRSLGHHAYVAQGGDWGAMICRNIAQLTSMGQLHACKAVHFNFVIALPPQGDSGPLSEPEKLALERMKLFQEHETGAFAPRTHVCSAEGEGGSEIRERLTHQGIPTTGRHILLVALCEVATVTPSQLTWEVAASSRIFFFFTGLGRSGPQAFRTGFAYLPSTRGEGDDETRDTSRRTRNLPSCSEQNPKIPQNCRLSTLLFSGFWASFR